MRYIGDGSVQDPAHARTTIAGYEAEWPRVGHGRWAVELRESGECIGSCGFVRWREGEADERPELAYGLLTAHWGKGFATEACGAALAWTAATLPFEEAVALTHPANLASQRVLRKLGFRPAGEVIPSHGRPMAFFSVPLAGPRPKDQHRHV